MVKLQTYFLKSPTPIQKGTDAQTGKGWFPGIPVGELRLDFTRSATQMVLGKRTTFLTWHGGC